MKYPLTLALHHDGPKPGFNITDAGERLLWHADATYDRSTIDLQMVLTPEAGVGDEAFEVRTVGERDFLRYTPFGSDATYAVTGADGRQVASIRRQGGVSGTFQAHYELMDPGGKVRLAITQENPVLGVVNGVVESIPIVGDVLAAAVLNPTFAVTLPDGTLVRRLNRGAFLLTPTFTLDHVGSMPPDLEPLALLTAMVTALHEVGRS